MAALFPDILTPATESPKKTQHKRHYGLNRPSGNNYGYQGPKNPFIPLSAEVGETNRNAGIGFETDKSLIFF